MSNNSGNNESVGSDFLTGAVIFASALLLYGALVVPAAAHQATQTAAAPAVVQVIGTPRLS